MNKSKIIERILKKTQLSKGQALMLLNGYQVQLSIKEARALVECIDAEDSSVPMRTIKNWRSALLKIGDKHSILDLSRDLGLPRSSLYRLLKDGRDPKLSELETLASAGLIK